MSLPPTPYPPSGSPCSSCCSFGVYLDILPISGIKSFNYEELTSFAKDSRPGHHLVLPVFICWPGRSRRHLPVHEEQPPGGFPAGLHQQRPTPKALPEKLILRRHALRNALLPVITILGLSVPGLIGGSVIFESIFAIPGMGQLFYMSVMSRDYPTIMGILVIGAFLTLFGNLLADISYAVADPRIRIG